MRFGDNTIFKLDIKFIGAPDLPMVWSLQKEWYERHCPNITFKEVARERHNAQPTMIDNLWHEPECGTKIFDRILLLRSHVVYPADQDVHSKRAVEEVRNDTFYFGTNILEEVDLWPTIGDHIVFHLVEYVIQQVVLDPENMWGHTDVPLHVTCKTERYRYGDGRLPNTLLDKRI